MRPAAACSSSARAAGPSISTSTKVFYKDSERRPGPRPCCRWATSTRGGLRCIPVGTKHACVATLFCSGQGRAFLFDPASPRATPAVIVLTAAAGTLGVAQALLPNGHVAVAMANFTANSLTVAELSADLATIHSLGDDSGTDRLHGAGARGARSPTARG